MKNAWPHFKIVIVEDDDFYNKLLTKSIKHYLDQIALIKGFTFELHSYLTFKDCVRNLDPDTDIMITDYYLNDGYNALDLLDSVKRKAYLCKVVVLSQIQSINTAICTLLEGASEFIYKDKRAPEKSSYVIEDIISHRLQRNYGQSSLN